MQCERFGTLIEERQLELLDDGDRTAFDAHAASCAGCARAAREAASFAGLLGQARDPGRDAALVADLRQALRGRRRRIGMWGAGAAVAAAALLLVAGWASRSASTVRWPTGEQRVLASGEQRALVRSRVVALAESELTRAAPREFDLTRGGARFVVEPGSGPFTVRTPHGEIRVVGTEFEVHVMNAKQSVGAAAGVAVLVVSGVVLYANGNDEQPVRAGEILVALDGEEPRRYAATDIRELVAENRDKEAEIQRLRGRLRRVAESDAAAPAADPQVTEKGPAATTPEPAVDANGPEGAMEATDWERIAGAIDGMVAFIESGHESPHAELMAEIAYLMGRLQAIADERDLGSASEAIFQPDVVTLLNATLLRSAAPDLPEEQAVDLTAVIDETVANVTQSLPGPMLAVEQRLAGIRIAVRLGERLRGRLPDEQISRLALTWGSTPVIHSISVTGSVAPVDGLTASIAERWAKDLRLGPEDVPLLLDTAREFVERYSAAREDGDGLDGTESPLEHLQGGGPRSLALEPRLARLRSLDTLLTIHADAERALLEVLPEAARERMFIMRMLLFDVRAAD